MPEQPPEEWFEEFKKINAAGIPSPALPSKADALPSGGGSSKGSERRRHPRFEVGDVTSHLARESLLGFIGVGRNNLARAAVNLCEGGAQFIAHQRIAPGTKIRVRIAVEKFNDVIEAPGVVRWCFQSAKKKEYFFIGVEFTQKDAGHDRKLAAMREWFTSPQYKAVRQSRLRGEKPPDIQFPK